MAQQAAPKLNAPMQAYTVLAIGILAVSAAAILIRLAQDSGVPSLIVAASRMIVATTLLTGITLHRHRDDLARLTRNDWILIGIAGLFLSFHFATWVSSLEYTSVLISGVLVTTTPIWVGILEVVLLKLKLTRGFIIGLAIALLGGLLITFAGGGGSTAPREQPLLGAGLSLAGAMTVAVYLIIGRKMRPRLPLLPYIWAVYGVAAILLTVGALLSGYSFLNYNADSYLWLVLLGVVPQLIGHSSLNYALAYLPATYISLATQLEPIGSAILALMIFGELPAAAQVLGSIVILGGVTIATLNPARQRVG